MEPLVIVGAGLAGYTLAREWRKLDRTNPLTIITRDDGRFYSKPVLSSAYTNNRMPAAIALNDAPAMAAHLHAEILPHTGVDSIDPASNCIEYDGKRLRYSSLMLALGADPIHVPIAGDAAGAVMAVNDLGDYTRFRAVMEGARHAAIIGAGLIGCEFANDLHKGGIGCDVVDPAPYPLSRLLPPEAGAALADALAAIGVRWHFGCTVAAVERAGTRFHVTLSDGITFATDAVLSAVGLRPRIELARKAGIRVNRGILVDSYLRSSAERVYAMGDCAEVEGLVLPSVAPIMQCARALARTLAGTPTPVTYPSMPVLVKTTSYPVVVASPRAGVAGEWHIERIDGGLKALYYTPEAKLEGFALLGSATAERQTLTRTLPALLG